jgi:hypothetical protein
MFRRRAGLKGFVDRCLASSVMLLDNMKLKHWNLARAPGTRSFHSGYFACLFHIAVGK